MTLLPPTSLPPERARNRHATSLALTGATSLAVLCLLAGCADEPAPTPRGPSAMKVQVLKAESAPAAVSYQIAGRIVAREPVLIHALQDGLRVERVWVEAGQPVVAGQPLVQLDARRLRADLQQAQQARLRAFAQQATAHAQALQAESRLRSAEDEVRRYTGASASGAVSELDMRARRTALEQAQGEREVAAQALFAAQAELASAEVALRLAAELERDGLLRAPVAGIVSERRVEAGTLTDAASGPLFRLARAGDREFEAFVDSSRLVGLRVGDAVEVLLTTGGVATPKRVTGSVRAIDSALAEDSRRGRVRVALSSAATDGDTKATPLLGSAATAVVQGAALVGVRLPATAVQFDPDPWVYVVDEVGRLTKRRVSLSGDGSVVLAGLAGGETVVRAAGALLSPGQVVEPVMSGASAAGRAAAGTPASAGGTK
jgi:RND family efflux transporter MFP subunit